MITYNWSIKRLICKAQENNEQNVVYRIRWECKAVDGQYQQSKADYCNVTRNPADNFTPYNQLTEAEVLAWVWGIVDKSAIETELAEKIQNQIAPNVAVLPLPWAN